MRKIRLQKTGRRPAAPSSSRADLNEPQRAAATAPDGYNLILAGPGSGKTRVITYRVAYLIARGVPAESILLVTFTRRAAREMVGRLETLIGPQAAQVWAGTFHHIGNRLLRRSAEAPRLRAELHDPRRRGPARPGPPGDGRRRARRHRPDGPEAGGGPAPDQLRLQRRPAARRGRRRAQPRPGRVGSRSSRPPPTAYAERKQAANCMDYDDLLGQWARLLDEFPDQRAAQARMFRHILIDEMQDTNTVQVDLVETIARAGPGNLTAVGDDAQSIYRFRGANYDNILKFPERNPGAGDLPARDQLPLDARDRRLHQRLDRPQRLGLPQDARLGPAGRGSSPLVVPAADAYEEAEFLCQQILELPRAGASPWAGWPSSTATTTTASCSRPSWSPGASPTRSGAACGSSSRPTSRTCWPTCRILVNPRDEPAWRRLLLLLPGDRPGQGRRRSATGSPRPPTRSRRWRRPRRWRCVPAKSKGFFAGFVADLRKVAGRPSPRPTRPPRSARSSRAAIPATVRARYERPDNRIADIEQLAVLAARYDSLERLIADLLLAGDVYGMDTLDADEPDRRTWSSARSTRPRGWSGRASSSPA